LVAFDIERPPFLKATTFWNKKYSNGSPQRTTTQHYESHHNSTVLDSLHRQASPGLIVIWTAIAASLHWKARIETTR
jgi:hypothetical protein